MRICRDAEYGGSEVEVGLTGAQRETVKWREIVPHSGSPALIRARATTRLD